MNSYYQVRSMLKRSMPERTRTTGIVAVLRTAGTTVCAIFAIALLVPLIICVSCLILFIVG